MTRAWAERLCGWIHGRPGAAEGVVLTWPCLWGCLSRLVRVWEWAGGDPNPRGATQEATLPDGPADWDLDSALPITLYTHVVTPTPSSFKFVYL